MDKLKLSAIGEKLKTSSAQMTRMVSGKMKDLLQAQTPESKLVDEATSETLQEPNWGLNLRICGMLNREEFSGQEVVKAIKKKISGKNAAVSQRLSLDLLEVCAMNCDKVFSEIASEKVLEEMVKMIDNGDTLDGIRFRGLELIRAWGESEDLAYLPVFRHTYEGLKTRTAPIGLPYGNPTLPSAGSDFDQQPLNPPVNYPISDLDLQHIDDETVIYHSGSFSSKKKKELLVTTRNSVELLSAMLSAEEPMSTEDDLTLSMLEKCKDSQPVIQRIIESINNDEAMLFEAINLNDELQQVIQKCEEIQAALMEKGTVGSSVPVEAEAAEKAKTTAATRESTEMDNNTAATRESTEMDNDNKHFTIQKSISIDRNPKEIG